MFTGIITDVGRVRQVRPRGDTRFEIETDYDTSTVAIGASIACSGACLTVVDKGEGWFAVDVSAETLAKTNLGDWTLGTPVNLERSMRLGDELGGHIVLGHVDGVGSIASIAPEGDSLRFTFRVPEALKTFVAPKGSIAVNGVSLTVNEVDGATFGVNIIPHTQKMTTFGKCAAGDRINLEVDVLARYVARLNERE
ncbi:MAG: riboflavin synthase [Alphaproteobacteria bacterium]|nr:riboflavin synthase [Alphaproteobacteria bacterium]